MKKLNLKDIQKEELKMLILIVEFLKKNNINYYLYGGTLLGAIRHKGFIPWDDDIDIILTRPEYNKLINELNKQDNKLDDDIYAIGYELGNSFDWPFIKIINKNIVVSNNAKCDKNLWIDIFVYDGSPKKSNFYWKKILFFRKIFLFKRNLKFNYNNENEKFTKKIKKFIAKILLKPFSLEQIIKRYVKICTKYNYDNNYYINDNLWAFNPNRKLSKDLLKNKNFSFEGHMFNGFENFDYILKTWYGDYMKLPPEDKRNTHSFDAFYVNDKN